MKRTVAVLAFAMLAQPALAIERDGRLIILTDDEMRRCDNGGGCMVIPLFEAQREIGKVIEQAYKAGRAEGCKGWI